MKMKNGITVLFLAICIVGCLWLIFQAAGRNPALREQAKLGKHQALAANSSSLGFTSNASIPTAAVSKPSRAERMSAGIMQLNVPIAFHGRILDQSDTPISGVSVRLRYRQYVQVLPTATVEKNPTLELTTDVNGRFELTRVQGDAVSIESIRKKGYQLSEASVLTYRYAIGTSSPDATNPVIFRMWRKQGADRLVTGDEFYGVVPDGRLYTLDLLAHKKMDGRQAAGDLRVSVQRPAKVDLKSVYDWSFSIDGVDGGVIESHEDFLNLAPEAGYEPHYEFHMKASNPNWLPSVNKQFYVLSRGKKFYSRISIEVLSEYNGKGVFSIKYFLNPTGSRNLEYDSRQLISNDKFFPPQ